MTSRLRCRRGSAVAGPLPSPLVRRYRGRRSVPARRSLVPPGPAHQPPRAVPPFSLLGSLPRLAQYTAANLFGGIPLYVPSTASTAVTAGLAVVAVLLAGRVALRWYRVGAPRPRLLVTLAVLAPPVGLLLLGVIFNSTPIELRYLAFATPFAGRLLAGALASLPRRWCLGLGGALLAIQAVALLGLMTRQETMQPARATAAVLADGGGGCCRAAMTAWAWSARSSMRHRTTCAIRSPN